jgi:uncharacterized 2Fe-2S/4Fe-4S cluster protein (DUF4445 family)
MKKSVRVEFLPFRTGGAFARGTNLLDAIKKAGLPLKSACGGKGTCGECLVQIMGGKVKTRASAALPKEVRDLGYALACQTDIEDDLTVELPKFEEQSIRGEEGSRFFEDNRDRLSGVFEVNPSVRKIQVSVPSATLSDNSSDLSRLQRRSKEARLRGALTPSSGYRRNQEQTGSVTAVLARSGSAGPSSISTPAPFKRRGLACDIRTTWSSAKSSTSKAGS